MKMCSKCTVGKIPSVVLCQLMTLVVLSFWGVEAEYSVGIGKADITGPVADVNLMALYGDLYSDSNVAISGIHTHASPAGFLQYVLYDVTSLGFVQQSFTAMVDGIVQSIQLAHNNMRAMRLYAASGELLNTNINRSPTAYLQNPSNERARYVYDVDKDMTLIKLVGTDGRGRGAISWFPVHCTSMNNTNRLISGDNKGAAEQFMEVWAKAQPMLGGDFVAAFAQSNVGDSSPNVQGAFCMDTGLPCDLATSTCNGGSNLCHGKGPNWPDDTRSTETIGLRQATKAISLWTEAQEEVLGPVDSRHVFLDMSNIVVAASSYTRAGRTCPPALGYSFAAGTTDGPGGFDFTQGDLSGNPFWNTVRNGLSTPTPAQIACHAPKPIILNTGSMTFPYAWQPAVTEISLMRAGQLVMVGVPGEMSTMAGRRMRAAVQDFVRSAWGDNLRIVISGLTNTYSGYIVTFEEYQAQRYEGASTLYGPYTLDAYIQEMLKLADAMIRGQPIVSSVRPPNLLAQQISLQTGVVLDDVPWFTNFGDVVENAADSYNLNDVVSVKFRSACPRNNLRTGGTFLTVERRDPITGTWQVIHTDNDWATKFLWARPFELSTNSYATIKWTIPANTQPGQYRIRHFGDYKNILGIISPFSGTSKTFLVKTPLSR